MLEGNPLLAHKDTLAKLLAKENIFVRHSVRAETASFDIKNRVLTLPVLKDMSVEITDLMVGHEVGHALWTLYEEYEAAVALDGDGINQSILNIVEDARIEKRVKRTYPGITKSFVAGYRDLYGRGFFGKTPVDELNILDRINLYFKMGPTFGVPFAGGQEEEARDLVDSVETFDDAVRVTKILQMLYSELVEQMSQNMLDAHGWVPSLEEEDDMKEKKVPSTGSDDDSDSNDEGHEVGQTADDDGEEDGEEKGNLPDPKEFNANEHYVEPGVVETEEIWNERKQELVDKSADQPVYFNLPKPRLNDLIIDYKTVLKEFPQLVWEYYDSTDKDKFRVHPATHEVLVDYNKFKQSSNKIINYMVKEFERKKAAKEYRRASVAKTGVLDVNKLHSYRYNEDVFLKKTLMPDGKNHGLVMLVDWSGSMTYHMHSTLKQLINLVWFCQKVNIPFEVYAFSSCYWAYMNRPSVTDNLETNELRKLISRRSFDMKPGDASLGYLGKDMALINFYSSRMSGREITDMSKALFGFAYESLSYYRSATAMYENAKGYDIGSTPLVEALVGMQRIIPWFKKSNKLDVVNLITLTDGEGNSSMDMVYNGIDVPKSKMSGYGVKPTFQDPKTRRVYDIEKFESKGMFSRLSEKEVSFLYQLLKDRYGINNIGIFLDGSAKKTISKATLERFLGWYKNNKEEFLKVRASQKKDGFVTVKPIGFDEYYLIPVGKITMDQNDPMDSAHEDMTKGQIRSAFKKSLKQKFGSRIFVDRMMNLIV